MRTRAGVLVAFDRTRIETAIARAAREVGRDGPRLTGPVADRVAAELTAQFGDHPPGVEDVQDVVERALMSSGLADVARAYVVFRRRRAELRREKEQLGVRDELKLGLGAVAVLQERYLLKDRHGTVIESTGEMLERAAAHVAEAEEQWQPGGAERWTEAFALALHKLDFLPNSPTLMNAGTRIGLLSGCVVLPLEDSLSSIFGTLADAALVHQAGGGTGYSFSHLRPRGDRVASTGGTASGPVSFLSVFDAAAGVVSDGGRRRGASMAVLDASHPDIVDFVDAKASSSGLGNFNLSVGVSDRFMRAVLGGGEHRLVNPRTHKVVGRIGATELFDRLCAAAWRVGDPGLVFLDRVNRNNPLPSLGRIEATNPCGEVPLLPYESCNLGSINLAHLVAGKKVDFEQLSATVRLAIRFLDDVIDVSRYPVDALEAPARATRKVGLGVMGLAEMLAALGIPYDSAAAVRLAGRVMASVQREARRASAALASERGPFPLYDRSRYRARGVGPLRNAQLTSVAPTGTVSLIAGTTSGIEPMFALAYVRRILGREFRETNPLFERVARERAFYSEELIAEVERTGTARKIRGVPPDVRAAFVTGLEISPEWHLGMQAAIQRHVDAAVAKTVNLPSRATVDDVRGIYVEAWRRRVKGVTVYRDLSRPDQVLALARSARVPGATVAIAQDYSGGCGGHLCEF